MMDKYVDSLHGKKRHRLLKRIWDEYNRLLKFGYRDNRETRERAITLGIYSYESIKHILNGPFERN